MRLAFHAVPALRQDLEWRLIYALLLPLFAVSEGVARLFARLGHDESEPARPRGPWGADARSQASIAASFVLMAKSMLQSSERRNRPERLSRP
jgi:hypothetical protein